MRTFRAADGRLIRKQMTDDERADRILLRMAEVVMPVLTILVFAAAAGVL